MEVRQLRYFVKIVEQRSISRAAQALCIAQPALSSQITNLENELACQLLSRSSRGVAPTPAGLEFYRRAQHLLNQWESLSHLGREQQSGPSGHVVVGLPLSVAGMLAVDFVTRLRFEYPAVTIRIEESPSAYLAELLLNGRLDVAVLFNENLAKGIAAAPALIEDLFVVGAPGAKMETPLQALDGCRMVMPAPPNSVRGLLDRACLAAKVKFEIVAEASSPSTMLQLAKAGVAATVLPWSVIGSRSPGDKLTVARLVDPVISRSLSVAVASQELQAPAMLAVRQVLLSVMQSLVASGEWRGARLPPTIDASHTPAR